MSVKQAPYPDDYTFLPARAARVTLEEAYRINSQPYRLTWGIDAMDEYVTPMIGGDLVTVIGRPGMGKTTVLLHLARVATASLASSGDRGIVLYATWETLVEETVALFASSAGRDISLEAIGRGVADMRRLEDAVIRMVGDQLAIFGRSKTVTREASAGRSTRVHNLDDLDNAILALRKAGTPVRFLLVDYLQRIPGTPGQDRSMRASENLERVKDMTLVHDIPVAMAVQSRRDVDDYAGLKMPGLSDAQWTSNVEQSSDKIVGTTRPWVYLGSEEPIRKASEPDVQWEVKPTTLCVKVIKQRWAPSGDTFVLSMDFDGLILAEQEPSPMPF